MPSLWKAQPWALGMQGFTSHREHSRTQALQSEGSRWRYNNNTCNGETLALVKTTTAMGISDRETSPDQETKSSAIVRATKAKGTGWAKIMNKGGPEEGQRHNVL